MRKGFWMWWLELLSILFYFHSNFQISFILGCCCDMREKEIECFWEREREKGREKEREREEEIHRERGAQSWIENEPLGKAIYPGEWMGMCVGGGGVRLSHIFPLSPFFLSHSRYHATAQSPGLSTEAMAHRWANFHC